MARKHLSAAVVLTVALFLSLSTASVRPKWFELDNYSFDQYVKDFDRVYATAGEHEMRSAIFTARLEEIRAHNRDPTKTWKEGVNHLSDKTEEEIRNMNGYKYSSPSVSAASEVYEYRGLALPRHVDWRTQGVVTSVKDQGRCGSCWAFAATEVIESHWAISTGKLPTLSEQQVLDCTPNPNQCGGLGGCRGGTVDIAAEQIINKGGIASQWTYPYRSYNGDAFQCQYGTKTPPVAKISGLKKLPSNEYRPLLEAVAHVGPMAVNIEASTWHRYESGVFDGCNQTNPLINHVVQLVGYGVDPRDGEYWLVRNSWSPTWGEDGYIRLRRREAFTCGIDLHPGDGTGCKDGPPTIKVCGTCGILYDASYPIIPK